MSRRQLILFIVTVSIIILAIAGGALTNWYGLNKKKQSPLLAMPENAILYFAGTNICSAIEDLTGKKFWLNIASYPSVGKFNSSLRQIDSVIRNHEDIYRYINNSKIVLSLHKTSAVRLDLLFIIPTKNRFDESKIKSLFPLQANEKFSSHTFRNCTIYTLHQKENEVRAAFAFVGGLLVLSPNAVLVEDAIRAFYTNLNPVRKISGNKNILNPEDNIYVNFSQLPALFNIFLNEKGIMQTKDIIGFATNGHFNFEASDHDFLLRGNLSSKDSILNFIDRFRDQSGCRSDIAKAASLSTAILISYNLSDYQIFWDQLKEEKKAVFENFEKKFNVSAEKEILPLINQNISLTITEPITEELAKSQAIWFKTDATTEAVNLFYNKKDERIPLTYNNRTLYPTQLAGFWGMLLGKTFNMPEKAWFCVIRDYLVFSASSDILQKLSDDYSLGHTLSSSTEFNNTAEKLASDGNLLIYINPVRAINILDIYLNETWLRKYKSQNFLLSFGPVAFQMANIMNNVYAELVIGHNDTKARILQKIWDFQLDTLPASKPFIVINHNNNKPEILIMDELNNLYLISSEGELQWKKPIGNALKGDIYMIDFYNNKKYQYLFATTTHLQCIDRLGRNVANYPIRIGNEAVTGLGVYQPPKGNQIKYFIGTQNQCVYGYDLSAKPLNGWNAKKMDDNLVFPVSYLTMGSKLFFYGQTVTGNLFIWDLKGNQIMKPTETQAGFINPFYSNNGIDKDDSYLISLDTAGNTWKIYLNGKKEMTKLANWSSETWFLYNDINNDKRNELIFIDKTSLVCYNNDLKIMNSVSLESFSTQKPELVLTKESYLLSYYNEFTGKLYLTDLQGIPQRNFPVDCSKYYNFYDLNKDDVPDLVGTSENKVFVARY